MKKRLLLFLFLCFTAVYFASSLQPDIDDLSLELQKDCKDPRGILLVNRIAAMRWMVGENKPIENALNQVIGNPQTIPLVRDEALYQLSMIYKNEGNIEQAGKSLSTEGFIRSFLFIGPFGDEGKEGYDEVYPPEKRLDFKLSYDGKERKVYWRTITLKESEYELQLDSLLYPAEKACAYVGTFIYSDNNRDVVLRFGANEAVKVFLNGDNIFNKKIYSTEVFDQWVAPLELKKGWNILLLKVCNQVGGWSLFERLTEGDGRLADGLIVTNDIKRVNEPISLIAKKGGKPSSRFLFTDPEDILMKRSKDNNPSHLWDYGYFLTIKRTIDKEDQKNIELLQKAAESMPKNEDIWIDLSFSYEDHNKEREALLKALEINPQRPEPYIRLAQHYRDENLELNALKYLNEGLGKNPEHVYLRCLRDIMWIGHETVAAALYDLRGLEKSHPENFLILDALFQVLSRLDMREEATKVREKYLSINGVYRGAWFDLFGYYKKIGNQEKAFKILDDINRLFPYLPSLHFEKASYLLRIEKPEVALSEIEIGLSFYPEWAAGLRLKGDILRRLGRVNSAMESYQAALIIEPQNENLKKYIEFLKPDEEAFEKKYILSDDEIPAIKQNKMYGENAIVLVDSKVVKVFPNGLSSLYVQRVVKILNDGGVDQFKYHSVSVEPYRESFDMKDCYILKPDGTRVNATVFSAGAPPEEYRMYYDFEQRVISFENLQSGDTIFINYKVNEIPNQNVYGRYFGDITFMQEGNPVILKQYIVEAPETLPLYYHEEGFDEKPIILTLNGIKTYRWIRHDVAKIVDENMTPGISEILPYIHISTYRNWDELGKWYGGFIKDQYGLDEDGRKQVQILISTLNTKEEKVRAIHAWLIKRIRYVGLEFGIHGYMPYKVRQIFHRGFGDCKDKAILFVSMLKEAGIDARMVLVRTKNLGGMPEEPASLSVFNHCIAYIPEMKLFIDGTAEYSSLKELPYLDQGIKVLTVDFDGKTEMLTTPQSEYKDNLVDYDAVITPLNGKNVRVYARVKLGGEECASVRRGYEDQSRWKERMENDLSASYPGTEVETVKFDNLSVSKEEVSFTFEANIPQFGSGDEENRFLPLSIKKMNLYASYAQTSERTLSLEIPYPWIRHEKITYELPGGWDIVDTPKEVNDKTTFGSFTRSIKKEGGNFIVEMEVILSVKKVSREEYKDFKDFCARIDKYLFETLHLKKGL